MILLLAVVAGLPAGLARARYGCLAGDAFNLNDLFDWN
jgi:hypothetical protein